jgi:hypothetical protein
VFFFKGNFLFCAFIASTYKFKEVCGIELREDYCEEGKALVQYLEYPETLLSPVVVTWTPNDQVMEFVCNLTLSVLFQESTLRNWFDEYDIVYMHNQQFSTDTDNKMWDHFKKSTTALKILITTKVRVTVWVKGEGEEGKEEGLGFGSSWR